ncbi:hypothetical protein OH492_15700 [Vibrio chagasii]|nr:hypothetical protein [Vibrio chagasii]
MLRVQQQDIVREYTVYQSGRIVALHLQPVQQPTLSRYRLAAHLFRYGARLQQQTTIADRAKSAIHQGFPPRGAWQCERSIKTAESDQLMQMCAGLTSMSSPQHSQAAAVIWLREWVVRRKQRNVYRPSQPTTVTINAQRMINQNGFDWFVSNGIGSSTPVINNNSAATNGKGMASINSPFKFEKRSLPLQSTSLAK